jgi:hypothetical protein
MRNLSAFRYGFVLAAAFVFCQNAWAREPISKLLDPAREELRAAKLSEKEIQLRLKIIENVATVKAYFPAADGGWPEKRNPKYWTTGSDGAFIPRASAVEAIRDLWRTTSGVRCSKLSALVMIKSMIDVADAKRLAELDEMLSGKVIPNELPRNGVGTIFEKPRPKTGDIFQTAELLPGDEVWFENPYFARLDRSIKPKFYGQEGHHVFFIGGGKVMDMYSRQPMDVEYFRETFLHWRSVRIVDEKENRTPKPADFQIKAVRRVIVDKL